MGHDRSYSNISPGIGRLITTFRDRLTAELHQNLVAIYLVGSVAFPGFKPYMADIDFHVIVRWPLSPEQRRALAALHKELAQRFRYGDRLDGFYIPLTKAKALGCRPGL